MAARTIISADENRYYRRRGNLHPRLSIESVRYFELSQILAEAILQIRVLQGELHGSLQITLFAAAIVAFALEFISQYLFAGEQAGDSIGELDLTARPCLHACQETKDAGGQK